MHDMHQITQFMSDGGPLMWPLLLLSLLLWYLLGKRFFMLQQSNVEEIDVKTKASLSTLTGKERENLLQVFVWKQNTKLKTDRRIITTLINIAPLLGLLGTVCGMVNSFAALSGTITIAQTSVAAGISEALVSTQLGLLVAIPALCINILLNRKEEVLALAIKENLNGLHLNAGVS